jgi:uncharacterized repeat protein (TIGR01451 family)
MISSTREFLTGVWARLGATWIHVRSWLRSPRLGLAGATLVVLFATLAIETEPARTQSGAPGGVATALKLWLKADAGITGTSPVIAWNDQSGGGNNATTQIGTAAQALVANGLNFHPVVRFTGVGGLEGVFNPAVTSNNISAFMVMRPNSAAGHASGRAWSIRQNGLVDHNNAASGIMFYRFNSTGLRSHRSGLGLGLVTSVFDKAGVFGTHFKTGNQQVITYNGTANAPVTFTTAAFNSDRYDIGTDSGIGHIAGDFAEVVLYTADQTAALTADRIQSYLALKYGVALSHNYVASDGTTIFWDHAANAGYASNIAGIGRDDASGLVQRQGRSANINVVTMGLDNTIAVDNASHPGSVADRQFLMWGDNGGSDLFEANITPPVGVTADRRMPRAWRVDETGTVGSVKVALPAARANAGPVHLIVSNDATFDGSDQWIQLAPYTAVGGTAQFVATDFDFTDGQYFTFAASGVAAPGDARASLKLWLKADADVIGSGTVTAWGDQSGRGNDATIQIGTATQTSVANGLNFNPVVRFTGQSGLQGVLDERLTSNNASAFIVMNPRTTGGAFGRALAVTLHPLVDSNNTAGGIFFYRNGLNVMGHRNGSVSVAASTVNKPGLFASHYKTGNQHLMVYGGSSQTPVTSTTTPFNSDRYNLATQPGGTAAEFLAGDIAEVVLYEADQAAAGTEARIGSYLALKYGITLSHDYVASNSAILWNQATNTGYTNNIAGIGRDDASALDQRQSRSSNANPAGVVSAAGDVLTIGNGAIAADSPSNPSAFAADRSFLVWGDNGAPAELVTPLAGLTTHLHLARIWKVQETGVLGPVTVRVSRAALRGTSPLLIRSGNTTFDSTDAQVPLVVNGAYFEGPVDFSSGEFFTFAADPLPSPGGVRLGLATWQKANVPGATSALWPDASGGLNDATQVNATQQPTFVAGSAAGSVNFNPAFRFDGADDAFDYASNLGIAGTADMSSIIAFKPENGGMLFGHPPGSPSAYLISTGTIFGTGVSGGGACSVTVTGLTLNVAAFGSVVREAQTATLRVNGGSATSGACSHNFLAGPRRLGARNANFMRGPIPEFIHYSRALTNTELQRVHSYVALKYGLTLEPTTDYLDSSAATIWSASGNTGYTNNIAGIGRDDESALDQRQSRTSNTTTGLPSTAPDIVTIGRGTIAADNASHTVPFAADRSFLLWGDNAASTLLTNAIAGSGIAPDTRRMTRVWRVRESGGLGTVTVRVASTALIGSNQRLVRSTDPTFATVTQAVPLTAGPSGYEGTIDFASGDYFTFAAVGGVAPGGVAAGLNLWLRADAGTNVNASNNFVNGSGSWLDQSGYGRHADIVAGTPKLVMPAVNTANFVNFHPAVQYVNSYFSFTNKLFANKFTAGEVFTVVKDSNPTAANNGHPFDFGGSSYSHYTHGTGDIYEDFGTTDRLGWTPSTGLVTTVADAPKAGVTGIIGLPINTGLYHSYSVHSALNDWGVRFDGFTAAETTTNAVNFALQAGREYVGATHNYIFHGLMPEIFLYERTLTEAERQRVNSYLGIKYGITQRSPAAGSQDYLSATGTTIWNGIANSAYHANVAGIGRDDRSALNQKQSKNIEPGSFVTIGLGPIAATNQANTNGFAADASFLVWGNDPGLLSVSADVTGGLYKRMARVWRVQETGTVGTVVLRIPYGFLSGRNQSLIRSADATFTDANTRIPLVRNGQFYEATVDFAAAEYFTFGAIPYEPGGVGGEALWVKANDGLLTDIDNPTQVTEWLDQSGGGNTTTELRAAALAHTDEITPSTDIVQVPVGVNFNPAVKFTGASGKSLKANGTGDWDAGPLSIFAVAIRDGAPALVPAALFAAHGSWEGSGAGVGLIANSTTYGLDGSGCSTALTTLPVTQPRLVRGLYTTAGNGNGGGTWMDGTAQGTGTACATSATTFFEIGGRTAGAGAVNNRIFNGKIAEVIVYKGALSAAQTDQVESYLAIKYGVTLSQSAARHYVDALGATIWDATLNATHKNNIAGIGRDDLSGLDQRQSKSSGPGDVVTVGLGTIAVDNLSNPNAFTADKNFAIWGHDGATSSWGTPVGSTLLRRVLRVWRVQETGTVSAVVVRIPRALVGVQTPVLLRSTDATFDGADTQVAMVSNGSFLEATIDFATGDYFTFASESAPAPLNVGDGLVTEGHIRGMVLNTPVCPAYPWQHAPRTTTGLTGGLTGSPVGTNTAAESTWIGDVTGDSIPDLVHAREVEGIAVWPGNGDGTFATTAITTSITSGFTVGHGTTETTFLGDLNGDAALDLLSVTDGGGVSANSGTRLWLGNGDGTFAETPVSDLGTFTGTLPGGNNIIQAGYGVAESTFLADANGDGRMDIVWVHDGNGTAANSGVWTWLGNGDGTFNHTPIVDTGFTGTLPVGAANIVQAGYSVNESTHAGDFNGDGRIDLLWVYDGGATPANSGTWFWAGNGDGTFSPSFVADQGTFTSGPSGANLIQAGNDGNQVTRTADVNNDGRLDIVWANATSPQGVWIWLGAGNGTFGHTPTADSGAFVSFNAGVAATEDNFIIDLNGDGALDFVYLTDTGATALAYLAVDSDGDGTGDLVDTDDDNDGIADASDSCPVPGSIGTGLQLWLKADAGATVDLSNNFLHWADQSPFARDANVVTGAPLKLDATVNFNPTARFDGSSYFQFGKSPFVTGFTAGEVFAVTKTNQIAGSANGNPYNLGGMIGEAYVWSDGNVYGGFATTDRLGWNPATGVIAGGDGPKAGVSAITGPGIDPIFYHLYGTHSAANDWGVRFDGHSVAATSTNTVTFALNAGNEMIGRYGSNFTGDLAEVILYNRALSAVEREEVNSYLATKYGVTLGHSYRASDDTTIYWDMTANAAYHNNVAGIGRDDGATLNQRQSISINPGSFVAMGLGTLAVDNPSHPGSFGTDRTFMMWGDNNASAGFDAVIAGPSAGMANRRMSRVWKVQETATVGSVMLGIPDSIGSGRTVYLVVSNDATFDAADQWLPLAAFAAGAATYQAASLDFANSQFFTFATTIHAPGGVTGMALWVKANDGPSATADGANVETWADRSGASKDLAVMDTAKDVQPTYRALALNFNPAISLLNDATSDQGLWNENFLGIDDTINYNIDGSVFFAHIPRKTTDCNTLAQLALPGADHPSMGHCANNGNQLFGTNDFPVANTTWSSGAGLTAPPDVPALSGFTWRYNAASSFFFRNNGAALANPITPSHSGRDFYLMRDADDNVNDGAGDMSETVMYARQLSAVENQKVESYLAIKYGVTLSQATPTNYLSSTNRIVWNAATSGAYDQNIAGIGRDDASALVQRQSQSVNAATAGNLVTIGLGAIAVDNVSNPNTFTADDSFLVWSDDGLAPTFTGPIVTPSAAPTVRMLRTWFVQESGIVGMTKIGVPFGTGGGAPVYVVVSNDPLFDGSDAWRALTPLVVGPTTYLADDVDFASGQYFTFATVAPEDYGDAAASYGTLTSANGPRHAIAGYDIVTGAGSLMLGTRIDPELDGVPSAAADADDTASADDEDGVVFPPLSPGQPASLTVTVTNSGPAARLNAWADWNGNGSFTDSGEQIATDLAVNAGSNTVAITVPPSAAGMVTFRFRLSTQTGLAPTGAAADGEVEDYQVALGAAETRLTITKTDGQASYVPGAAIAYTVTVTNAGPANASGIAVTDNVPASITGVMVNCVAAGSASCGTNATAGNNVSFTGGSIAAGAGNQLTLTIQGIVDASTTGALTNTAAVVLGPSQTDSIPSDNQATDVDTQGASQTNLEITKTGPATVMVGENMTYIVTVTNHGPSIATNVVVTDPTPAGLTFVSTGTGCTTPFPCALGTMAPGEVRQISATYLVPPGYPTATPIQNTASVSGSETDTAPGNNSQTATTTALPTADIEVLKTVDNPTPFVGGTIAFTITVQNHGPSDATGVEVTDLLPPGLTLVAPTASQGAYDAVAGRWTVGTVPLSGSATLTLTATVTEPGSLTNLAVRTAQTEPDPKSSNDSGGVTLTAAPSADIGIDKDVDRSTALLGETVTFTVTVTNRGPSNATGVAIDDVLPAGLSLVNATSSQGTYVGGVWTIGNLGVSDQETLTIVATLTQAGALVNHAAVRSSDQHDPNPLNDGDPASVNAEANSDIRVTKSVSNGAPTVGTNVTYTIAATNLGPSDAANVDVLDVLPAGVTFVSAAASHGTYDDTTGVWNVGPLANTATAVLTITATVTQNGTIDNTAMRQSSAPFDPNPSNDGGTATFTAGREADLVLTKTPNAPTVTAGASMTWTIVVTNNGPSPATNALVTDTFPAAFVGPTWTCSASAGSSCGAASGSGAIAMTVTLAAGGTATFTASGSVDPSASGSLVNVASVAASAGTSDPNPSNNSASSTVTVGASANLIVTKTGPATAAPGATVTYTIVVTNTGPSGAASVMLDDPTPAGLTLDSVSGACTAFPCALGMLPAGAAQTVTAQYAIPRASGGITIANTASVSSATADPVAGNNSATATTPVTTGATCDVNGDGIADFVTGAGPGGGPHVRVWTYAAGVVTELSGLFAYDPVFPGGVSVACRDLTGDGVAEVITGAGPGGGPHVRIWSYTLGALTELYGFYAYSPYFPGGVTVGAGDVDGDGLAELITGAGPSGGPHVRIWSLAGGTFSERFGHGFFAHEPGFPGGVFVSAGDVDGDGVMELVTGMGAGGTPRVQVWSLAGGILTQRASFDAYHPAFPGGVSVAMGDIDGDGVAEVITGAGPGGGPHVRVWRVTAAGPIEAFGQGFFAYSPYFPGGVYVAAGDVDGDGVDEIITGARGGGGPHVRVWKIVGGVLTELYGHGFYAYDAAFPGGSYVGR